MASTALATILVTVLLTKQPEPSAPLTSYVAMLADDQAKPIAVVTGDARSRQLVVKVVAQQTIPADKSLELWAVPKDGPPRSLGLLAADGSITLPLPENATPDSIPLLAVTLEPKGGSPNPNGPTGPIVFKGAWVQI
jgi:anti-sigma-K factor RskA